MKLNKQRYFEAKKPKSGIHNLAWKRISNDWQLRRENIELQKNP